MRKDIYEQIQGNREFVHFLRMEPTWYKILSRNPTAIKEFQKAAYKHYKKTFPDRVDKVSNGVQFASMMLSMLQSINQTQ